jgi:hypothetical protein
MYWQSFQEFCSKEDGAVHMHTAVNVVSIGEERNGDTPIISSLFLENIELNKILTVSRRAFDLAGIVRTWPRYEYWCRE